MVNVVKLVCKECGNEFTHPVQRGRKPVRCPGCKAKDATTTEPKPVQSIVAPVVLPEPSVTQPVVASEEVHDHADPVEADVPVVASEGTTFQVWVGNLGIAFTSVSEKDARASYAAYVKKSGEGYGQVGFEPVRLERISDGVEPVILESYNYHVRVES